MRETDLNLLDPTFRERVVGLLQDMRYAGHEPIVWETYRSPERAKLLASVGVGVVNSMHCYGLAVDIVDQHVHWSASKKFWSDQGRLAEARGLTWGGRFSRVDKPHVQAVPVRLQAKIRRASPTRIAEIVKDVLR